MATQDKLQKSLEALKNISDANQTDGSKKKDKVYHCHILTEAISNPSIKTAPNFQYLLSLTIEALLKLCDDPESDIRMTSEECLNKIIRASSNGSIWKIQIELHKEIKRNGPARSLRASLWRFAQLAHLIRPLKGKAYVDNLFPNLCKVIERPEEQIHETLANSISKIMKNLGSFASDNEIKSLLVAFLANITHPQSAVIRRATANSILHVCLNCRKPFKFVTYCLNNILDLLIPVNENVSTTTILGVLNSLKVLLPHFNSENISNDYNGLQTKEKDLVSCTEKQLMIYELCLYYLPNKDHNIVNASLETLNVLLQNCNAEVKEVLLSKNGPIKNRIYSLQASSMMKLRSPSQLSVATNITSGEENVFGESELTDTMQSDIERWIDESKLSVMNITYAKTKESVEKSMSLDTTSNLRSSDSVDDIDLGSLSKLGDSYSGTLKSQSICDNLDRLTISENSSEKSSCTDEKLLNTDTEVSKIDIGEYLDKNESILYCSRLIAKSFLLSGSPGQLLSDKTARVSVKSLALTCLASIVKLYPNVLLQYLDKNGKISNVVGPQDMSDLLLYADHSDPQLRGVVRMIIGNFIKAVFIENNGNYGGWITSNSCVENRAPFQIDKLIQIIVKGLEDESANCTRQTLTSLNVVLEGIIESRECKSVIPILRVLPILSKNPYWLVKVGLCELVSNLPYVTIHHVLGDGTFQSKVVYNILIEMLEDNDQRVRTAVANCVVDIIPHLYDEHFQTEESTTITKAILYRNVYLTNLKFIENDKNLNRKHFIENMPFPFKQVSEKGCDRIEFALSNIVNKLYKLILTSTSKYLIHGCIETLCLLSIKYPSTVYTKAWVVPKSVDVSGEQKVLPDLLNLCNGFLQSSTTVYDLMCHLNLLELTSNLLAGQSAIFLRPIPDPESTTRLWDMFENTNFSDTCEIFFSHIIKLLNIFHHVINDLVPAMSQSKPVLPSLPSASNLSPIKRRKSDLDKKMLINTAKSNEKEEKAEKSTKLCSIASFAHLPHYLKIYEVLKSAYSNYKVSLDSDTCERFLEIMRKILNSLSILMEIGSLTEFGRIADELLTYLRSTFSLDPTSTVANVQQMLKCLFATNLTANITEILNTKKKDDEESEEDEGVGFYYHLAHKPYNELSSCINSLNTMNKIECDTDNTLMGYLHRKDVKQSCTFSRSNDKILANYIRIFEPMVIKSLKQYTVTSDVKLQCQVLQLLSQLVQLRVNYCLLDSEQVFIGFVLKQFEYIEEGQIPLPEELIPKIFQFLVQLSYSKQHSKCIIGVPKIIQLCDGLLASGQPPLTHCIPALHPIVEDIFLTRNKSNTSDMKELETTREVVLAILLKLAEYHEVIDLLVLILEDSKFCADDPEKWQRWSEQIVNAVLPMLKQNKLRLDNSKAFNSMRKFVFAVNPNALKPVDSFIVMLFQEPPLGDNDLYYRWLSKIIILLLVLSTLKEDQLISKISRLKGDFSPSSIFEKVVMVADPLNVTNCSDIFEHLAPEVIFIRFIFRVIEITSEECLALVKNQGKSFLVEQFSTFLMYCLHIFQSGTHCKITNVALKIINQNIPFEGETNQLEKINRTFLTISMFYPTLTFQWCYLLTLWNYKNTTFWSKVMGTEERTEFKNIRINLEIAKTGAVIVFCDYLIENQSDTSQLNCVLNNVQLLVKLYKESPVSEFITSLHRKALTSELLIEALAKLCHEIDDPLYTHTLLKCIKSVHPSQDGKVLHLLITRLLKNQDVIISRNVVYLASRKVDVLLTLGVDEVNAQLPRERLVEIKNFLITKSLVKKHEALVSLLNKLSSQFYDLSPIEFDQRRVVNPADIKQLNVDKKWFLTQIQGRYSESRLGMETAELLNKLEYSEVLSFMSSADFNKMCIKDCILLSLRDFNIKKLSQEPDLLKASTDCLLKDITGIISRLPKPHHVYHPVDRETTSSEVTYSSQMTEVFKNKDFSKQLHSITPSVSFYIASVLKFPKLTIPNNSYEDILKFAVISLESINFLLSTQRNSLNINVIHSSLQCAMLIFKENHLSGILGLESQITWLSSAVNSVYKLVTFLLINKEPLPSMPKFSLKLSLENMESCAAGHACYQLYILVSWLDKIKKNNVDIPKFLLDDIKNIIVSLSRMPVVNSYVLIPTRVWKTGWEPTMFGTFNTQVPPLPIELLQEIDILEEYIFRITLLGWTSRQQFEETWMCLLSVCNPMDNCEPDEVNDIVHGTSLAIKAITALLLKSLYFPNPANALNSELMHVSRNSLISDESTSVKKLKKIHNSMQQKFYESTNVYEGRHLVNVFDHKNFEKLTTRYGYGQMSIRYFLVATNIIEESSELDPATNAYECRVKMLEEHSLDLTSCLQFLLDYYSQIMKAEVLSHIRVLYEAVRSTVIISDLFTEKSQFSWMMNTFLELSKTHTNEDELIHQYIIVGLCKSASILMPDLEVFETIKKMLVQYLKSLFVTTRVSCLMGILYLLEGLKINNISIGGISDEMQLILPLVVEYVQSNLNATNSALKKSQDHTLLVWSIAFYLIENIDEMHMETNFVLNTLQTAFLVLKDKNSTINSAIVKGLERLIIVKKSIMAKIGKQVLKIALDYMKQENDSKAFLGTQLLITYMYTDCWKHLENARLENNQTSPDHLVQTIEKISAMFEKVKKGYDFEVKVLTSVLPDILNDFFAPSDILTKVIGEFLSPQQPHPKLLSRVVFEVFGSAIERDQLSLLQDWVVFSLSNFTQSFSIGLATWCLTCFFISASTNQWLRSVFPYIQTRVGRYEYEDRKMLCIAGSDFYRNLTNDKQKETFIENFKKVKDKPDMPYNDLLKSL